MKILWQAHETGMSGANICLLEYLDILQTKGFEQHVIVPGEGAMLTAIKNKPIGVSIVQSYPWMTSPSSKDKFSTQIRKAVRKKIAVSETEKLIETFKPDFVATNTIANPTAAYGAKSKGKKHIWFVHEFGEEDHGYLIAGNAKRGKQIINALSDKIVFNSKIIQEQYTKFTEPAKRFLVYNGVNLPRIEIVSKSYSDKIKMMMLGQIASSKNQLDALKALKICVNNGLDIELNIAGSAENKEYLQVLNNFIGDESLQSRVNFLGVTNAPETLLVQHEVLLMCSKMEAFGRVTVEANKCGLLVIAANTGGSVELVIEGENGYLYESGNAEDLASKILKYSESKNDFNRARISNDAHEKFNLVKTGQQLLQVFS